MNLSPLKILFYIIITIIISVPVQETRGNNDTCLTTNVCLTYCFFLRVLDSKYIISFSLSDSNVASMNFVMWCLFVYEALPSSVIFKGANESRERNKMTGVIKSLLVRILRWLLKLKLLLLLLKLLLKLLLLLLL